MVSDSADAPDGIVAPWEVFDHDMNEFKTDTGLQIRCGKKDGPNNDLRVQGLVH